MPAPVTIQPLPPAAPPNSRTASKRNRPKLPLDHNPDAVREARVARHLTQVQLAELIGRSHTLICEIERGTRNARPEVLRRLAASLECPIEILQSRQPSRRCPVCAFRFDEPGEPLTPLHLADGTWCAGGKQPSKAAS